MNPDLLFEAVGKPFADSLVQQLLAEYKLTDIPQTSAKGHSLSNKSLGVEILFAGPDFSGEKTSALIQNEILVCSILRCKKDLGFKPWSGESLWKGIPTKASLESVVEKLGDPKTRTPVDDSGTCTLNWHVETKILGCVFGANGWGKRPTGKDREGRILIASVGLEAWSQRIAQDITRLLA